MGEQLVSALSLFGSNVRLPPERWQNLIRLLVLILSKWVRTAMLQLIIKTVRLRTIPLQITFEVEGTGWPQYLIDLDYGCVYYSVYVFYTFKLVWLETRPLVIDGLLFIRIIHHFCLHLSLFIFMYSPELNETLCLGLLEWFFPIEWGLVGLMQIILVVSILDDLLLLNLIFLGLSRRYVLTHTQISILFTRIKMG